MNDDSTNRKRQSGPPQDEVSALKREIAALQAELTATQAILSEKNAQLERILNTLGWRLLSKYGRFKHGVLLPLLQKFRRTQPSVGAISAGPPPVRAAMTYAEWAKACEAIRYDPERAARRVALLERRPKISVITPVYNTPADVLEATIRSVRRQYYPDWELCLFDDASREPHIRKMLARAAADDPRIVVSCGLENAGISEALNGALGLASGEYVAFLDHDDEITPDALLEMATAIARTDADILYSDEDKYDARGRRHDPFFKPDWSPDLFLSLMYTCHLTVMRADLVRRLGGFRLGFEGSQDYDLWLRATEETERIVHVPMILYHWRQLEGSTAVDVSNKSYAHDRSKRAITEALERRGIAGTVGDGATPTTFHVVRHVVDEPLVTVIIPTRDRLDLLRNVVDGLENRTDYRNIEIIIVDNGSKEAETLEYLAASPHRVIRDDGEFNFSRLNNVAAAEARGEYLLLLNNDVEPLDPGWLRAMVEHGQRPSVGIVGAKLIFPSGKIQHAGVVLGIGGVAGHSHKQFPKDAPGYFQALNLLRNYSAVTAACMLVRLSVFNQVGGFDEANLAVAFNDVDFCLRVRAHGYLVVWTPYATLLHYESESRGYDLNAREIDYMIERWNEELFRDPYYNPNLTLVHEDFSLDVTRPDGYRAVAGASAADGGVVEVAPDTPATASFRATHDGLGGVALQIEGDASAAVVRVTLCAAEAVGGEAGEVVLEAAARVRTVTPRGDLFVLFDEPLVSSQAAYAMRIACEGGAVRLRATADGSAAFRLLYR
ncbi:MAG TPA: glycosyltransferase family 2 protein [Blastocatellia bacterium]|nr:glycosyltransferase family 2 protein [Blastocatellia bacterium]